MVGVYGLQDEVNINPIQYSQRMVDSNQVVPFHLAHIGHARYETVVSIDSNHMDICKFPNELDRGYRLVSGALEDYITAATEPKSM